MPVNGQEGYKPVAEQGVQDYERRKAEIVQKIISAFTEHGVTNAMISGASSVQRRDEFGRMSISRVNVSLKEPVAVVVERAGRKQSIFVTTLTWQYKEGFGISDTEVLLALHTNLIDPTQMARAGRHADLNGQVPDRLQQAQPKNVQPTQRRSTPITPQPTTLQMLAEVAEARTVRPTGVDRFLQTLINAFSA